MKPFDGRTGKRLPKRIVGDLRFFGFYIGNGTLLAGTNWGAKTDIDIICEPSEALGNVFALTLFRNYDFAGNSQQNGEQIGVDKSSTQLIGEYIEALKLQSDFPLEQLTLNSSDDRNWRDAIVRFFGELGQRKLTTVPLKEIEEDYADWILYEGGYLERLVAIFCNVLRFDQEYNVMNEAWARFRASQYIRIVIDDAYQVKPPFKEWETTLWM